MLIDYAALRKAMVSEQIEARGIQDPRVLAAMRSVPREEFCEPQDCAAAYGDRPIPIGRGQTISQPFMVAAMAAILELKPGDKVLDIGSGSGYSAAVMSLLCAHVYGVELVPQLALDSAARLARLGYSNVTIRQGDGRLGWPEEAPFDAINIAAAAEEVPQALLDQLAEGGRLIMPVGPPPTQTLMLHYHEKGELHKQAVGYAAFIPLVDPGKS